MSQRVTAFEVERYLAGEAPAEVRAAVEEMAAEDPAFASWLEERKRERQAFRLDPRRRSFASLAAEAEKRPRRPRWASLLWMGSAGAALAATAAVTLFLVGPKNRPDIAVRGGVSVQAAVLRGGQAEVLRPGSALRPGDRIRLRIDDPHGGYVAVLLQERSCATEVVYAPDEVGALAPGSHTLPGSLELDEQLGEERLYVILSAERGDVNALQQDLRNACSREGFSHGWLPGKGARLSTLSYTKRPP